MDKKLKKVLIWSSVISVVCVIFLYSISYVFPIPAIEIKEWLPVTEEQTNTISDLDKKINLISAFEHSLIESHISYTKYRNDNYMPQFFIYEINNKIYLKPFLIHTEHNNENISNKIISDAIQVDGDELVSVLTANDNYSASFFVYNKQANVVTEHFLSGKTGRIFKLDGEPTFVQKCDNEISLYNCLVIMDKNKLIYLSLYNNIEKYFYWKTQKKPTGFFYLNYKINGYEKGFEEHTFVAHDGMTFYLFDYIGELISKNTFPNILTQIVANSQLYIDNKNTYIIKMIDARKSIEEKNISIEVKQILKFNILLDTKLNKINTCEDIIYFGYQKSNNYELGMLILQNIRDHNIEEVEYYKFVIPGQLLECDTKNNIEYFRSDIGIYTIPQWQRIDEIINTTTKCYNLDQYPFDIIYGESHFAIRKILHNSIMTFPYESSIKPDNLQKLFLTLLPYLILFSVVGGIFVIPIYLSRKKERRDQYK